MHASDERELVKGLSVLRILVGLGTLAFPTPLLRLFMREPTRNAKLLARFVASRELALGAATLEALEHDERPVRIVELNMLVDGLDGVSALLAYRRLPKLGRFVAVAGAIGAVGVSARLRSALD